MATNFLHATGTNGLLTSAFKLLDANTGLDTGLNGLTNGSAVTSAHTGGSSNGIFSQTDFAHAQYGYIWFVSGATFTPTAGGTLTGWFLQSTDGGTTFEGAPASASSSVPALGRSPDFIIPVYEGGSAIGTGIKFSGLVPLPYLSCKVILQNNSGVTLGASTGNQLWCGPVSDQY